MEQKHKVKHWVSWADVRNLFRKHYSSKVFVLRVEDGLWRGFLVEGPSIGDLSSDFWGGLRLSKDVMFISEYRVK